MKILHIVLSLGKGGAEKLLVDNLPRYIEKGHEVSILQLSSILEASEYIESVKNSGIGFYSLSDSGFRDIRLIYKLRKFLKKHSFDVVHVHLFPCLYWVSLATLFYKKRPVLVFTEHSTSNERNTKFYFQPIEKLIYCRYDGIIAISERVREKLLSWLNYKNKTYLIYNGIDINRFDKAEGYSQDFWTNEYDFPRDANKIIMVSRFSYPKDPKTLLLAMEKLTSKSHLFFVGDGDQIANAKLIARDIKIQNKVHFMGFRMDIPQLMKSADLIVLSSLHEGMSGVTLEALASGTPFLGSNVVGIKEFVANSKCLFESQNPVDLAQKIDGVLNNPLLKKEMQMEGRTFVQQYDIEKMVQAHLQLYEKLLNEKRKA